MIKNASKTKFVYTTIQWETTITQALKKNTCDVKILMHDDFVDLNRLIKFQNVRMSFKKNVKQSSLERLCWRQVSKLSLRYKNQNSSFFNIVMRMITLVSISEQLHQKPVTQKIDQLKQSS